MTDTYRAQRRLNEGFTLLEMLVSIAIIGLVSVILGQVFISTLRTNTKTEVSKEVKQSGDLVLGSIVRMIQNAQSVTSACSDLGTTGSTLVLINPDGGTTTLGCVNDGGLLRMASTSATQVEYLSSEGVKLTGTSCADSSVQFVCKGATGVPSSVTISFTLTQKGTPVDQFEQASQMFQTSAIMRNNP